MNVPWDWFIIPHTPAVQVASTHTFGGVGQSVAMVQPPLPPVPVVVPMPPRPVELLLLAPPVLCELVMLLPVLLALVLVEVVPPGPSKVPTRSVQLELTAATATPPSSKGRQPAKSREKFIRSSPWR
jgi:hypothetical protein